MGIYVDLEGNQYGIVASQTCGIDILALDAENIVGVDPSWVSSPATVYDPNNYLLGSISVAYSQYVRNTARPN